MSSLKTLLMLLHSRMTTSWPAMLILLLVTAFVPVFVGNLYYLQLFNEILIITILALSLNLLIGYTGLVSLGHAAFLGIGSYASALTMQHIYPSVWAGLGAGVLSAGITALVIGVFCIRLSGLYFAMITLAFSQAFYAVAFFWNDVTGGDDGLIDIPRPSISIAGVHQFSIDDIESFYYFSLIIVANAMFWMWIITRSSFGVVLKAIRENPERVEFLGLAVHRYKLAVFVISACFGGLAGGLFAPFQGFISPDLLYWTESGEIVLMTILGGINSFMGPAIGAGVLIFVRDIALNYIEYWKIVVGTILIVVVLFVPGGIVGFCSKFVSNRAKESH